MMILIMPFEMSPHLYLGRSFLGVISDFTVIKLLGLMGFGWALLQIVTRTTGERIFASLQARLFSVLFVGVTLSATLNDSALLAITKYLAFVLFLPFVLVTVQTQADLRRVVYAIVIAMMIAVPYAMYQQARWGGRLGVGLYETNYFAANLVLVVPVAFAIAADQRSRMARLLWGAAGLFLVYAVVHTSSRGGYLGLLVVGLIQAYRRWGALGSLAALGLLLILALPTDLGERAVATFDRDAPAPSGLKASNDAHTALFWGGLRMVTDAPLLGVGPQRFKDFSQEYSGLETPYIAHNTYLELAAEAGLPMLIVFVLLVGAAITTLGRATKVRGVEDRSLAAWADGLRIGLIGFAVCAAFISAQYEKFFWLVVFLSIVVGRLSSRQTDQRAEAPAAELART